MTALSLQTLRADPAIARALGDRALLDVVALMSTDGDCDVCHEQLGQVRLAITARRTTTAGVTVVPRHAACGPSTFEDGAPVLVHPPMTHQYVDAAIPLGAGRGSAFRKPAAPDLVGVVIINPSVDVQVGEVDDDGRWVGWLTRHGDATGLSVFTPSAGLPPATWGAALDSTGTRLSLRGPSHEYDCTVDPAVGEIVREKGMVQVVLVERPHTTELGGRDGLAPLLAAMSRGEVWSAMAPLGASPASLSLRPRGRPPGASADAESVHTTDAVRAAFDDAECTAAALFSDDPVLRRAGVLIEGRVPVLLVEPVRAILIAQPDGPRREARAEAAVAQGLAWWDGARPSPNPARDWSVSWSSGRAVLAAPYDTKIADVSLPTPPQGWLTAAAQDGRVLVMLGALLGVRAAPGKAMTDDQRVHELRQGREAGIIAWSLVIWS